METLDLSQNFVAAPLHKTNAVSVIVQERFRNNYLYIGSKLQLYFSYCILKKLKKKDYYRVLWWLSGKESTCQCRRHVFDP